MEAKVTKAESLYAREEEEVERRVQKEKDRVKEERKE